MDDIGTRSFVDTAPEQPTILGFLHEPTNAHGDGLVLTHGAGGNCETPLLVAVAEDFAACGLNVLRCDLPFRQIRPKGPPSGSSAKRDQDGLRRAVMLMRERWHGRVYLGGLSYGGRQASMLLASQPELADGLLLLSYPLHPPGRPAQMRTAHFPDLRAPVVFVHGTNDAFASSEELHTADKLIPARTKIVEIVGAGHSLLTKQNRNKLTSAIVTEFVAFFSEGSALRRTIV